MLSGTRKELALAACALALLLASQALIASAATPAAGAGAGAALGRAGFAYAGGLRVFAAAVLWNRIEPVFHDYYSGVPLSKQTYMMPTLRMVTALDPQFEQAYYLASWLVFDTVSPADGIDVAREGFANNPDSGMLAGNLVQVLFVDGAQEHRAEIEPVIDRILTSKMAWFDDDAKYEALAIVRDPLREYGRTAEAEEIDRLLEQMRESGVGLGDHDHDGDGVQDH